MVVRSGVMVSLTPTLTEKILSISHVIILHVMLAFFFFVATLYQKYLSSLKLNHEWLTFFFLRQEIDLLR